MSEKAWDPALYSRTSRFVSDLGQALIEMLEPRPGDRILDLGCGDGALTLELMATGAKVVGVDASAAMVEAARRAGVDARQMDARRLTFDAEFDGVLSNACLHWVPEASAALAGVARALKPGGRFVAEFGGEGNVQHVCTALQHVLGARGVRFEDVNPWYFPAPDAYNALLAEQGFEPLSVELFERPTPIPGQAADWLRTFGDGILAALPEAERESALAEAQQLLQPDLCDNEDRWSIDYVRIRVLAKRV